MKGSSLPVAGHRILVFLSSPRWDASKMRGTGTRVGTTPGARLLGRQRERDVLERLLDGAREGHGGVLVVRGEPGVGKTALLEYAIEASASAGGEFRVVRTDGVEGEMELPYAALQQLSSPMLDLLERLPEPQREALSVAFGLSSGQAPDSFLVGLAVLGLFSEAAQERPLLALVDDANGSIERRPARSPSWVAACSPSTWRSCSRREKRARRSSVCPRWTWNRWGAATPGRCWSRSCRAGWTRPSWSG
jgi:hypothetical protein